MCKSTVVVAFALFAGACSSEADDPMCERPIDDAFVVHYAERAGSCGPIEDHLVAPEGQPLDPRVSCSTDTGWLSKDSGCSRSRSFTCDFRDEAGRYVGTATRIWHLSFVSDREWEGSFDSTEMFASGNVCHSLYDVTLRK